MSPWWRGRPGEFLRFCLVGGASALAGFLLLYVLTDLIDLHYLLSFVLAFLTINLLAFIATGSFAFRAADAAGRLGLLRYYAVSAASLAGNSLALAFLVEVAGLWYLAAAALLAAVNAPLNYYLHRRVTFRIGGPPAAQR